MFWFLDLAASLRVHDCKYKAKYAYVHKFWNGKKSKSLSKVLVYLCFQVMTKIHSSLKADKLLNMAPTKINLWLILLVILLKWKL